MKRFRQYLLERENASPTDAISGIGLGDMETPSGDDSLMRIAKIAVDDHRTDTLSFFQHLAKKDRRIEAELKEYKDGIKNRPKRDNRGIPGQEEDNRDIVAPNSADSTGGTEEGGDGG